MRINQFIAKITGMSRRSADKLIAENRVLINGRNATYSDKVGETDIVKIDNRQLENSKPNIILSFNKPAGYIVSRDGQGSKTIYDILPYKYHHLKPIGRLDKNSSGLLLLTNDGLLANRLTHPRYSKLKIYDINLDRPLIPLHRQMISSSGVMLDDGLSKFKILQKQKGNELAWTIHMTEGRNRQIRRTFDMLGYKVNKLHRVQFGEYILGSTLSSGSYQIVSSR